ncbi:hypothetical protein GCM10022235_51670 [Kribbella ginsengisoli]|uniref:Uncharacterized protein n=1 Tax=Kribbella ginsengisoli TaxID=363865 RepID=A0ABP6Y176_9ACTN
MPGVCGGAGLLGVPVGGEAGGCGVLADGVSGGVGVRADGVKGGGVLFGGTSGTGWLVGAWDG